MLGRAPAHRRWEGCGADRSHLSLLWPVPRCAPHPSPRAHPLVQFISFSVGMFFGGATMLVGKETHGQMQE